MQPALISGFSKLTKEEQIHKIAAYLNEDPKTLLQKLSKFWHADAPVQETFDSFTENTVSNYYLPYNIAPNFIINNRYYFVPMVIEESSVVAAAAHAAKFWANHGGFKCRVTGMTKLGQIHFFYHGNEKELMEKQGSILQRMKKSIVAIEVNMKKRGGGITGMELKGLTDKLPNYYQVMVKFDTRDSMGANFINSCLETMAAELRATVMDTLHGDVDVLMSILSNYTPECTVECEVETQTQNFEGLKTGFSPEEFAERFQRAVRIAEIDPYRATTHNKGIFNGVDAVVLASGNDFRAVEACGHAHAASSGRYRSLTSVRVSNNLFHYRLELPLALGTVGGLTKLHPLAELSMHILGKPSAKELMMIAGAAGLANNFSAVRSLVTHGIQKGHMKMHLNNILEGLSVTPEEKQKTISYFADKTISFNAVELYLNNLRSKQ